jgi:hypothetical protein
MRVKKIPIDRTCAEFWNVLLIDPSIVAISIPSVEMNSATYL